MSGGLVLLIVLALLAVFGVFVFNHLVTLKHNVGKGLGEHRHPAQATSRRTAQTGRHLPAIHGAGFIV